MNVKFLCRISRDAYPAVIEAHKQGISGPVMVGERLHDGEIGTENKGHDVLDSQCGMNLKFFRTEGKRNRFFAADSV